MNVVKHYRTAATRPEERIIVQMGDAWYQLSWTGGARVRDRGHRYDADLNRWVWYDNGWRNTPHNRLMLTCGRRLRVKRGARMRVVGRMLVSQWLASEVLDSGQALADFPAFLAQLGIGTEEE